MKNGLEQLTPIEGLDGKCTKSCGDGTGIERDTDVVMKHLNPIGIKGTIKG
jgi:hypothetical protein